MKTCPLCAESLQDDAVKCRYCGADLGVDAGKVGGRTGRDLLPLAGIAAASVAVIAIGVIAGVLVRSQRLPAEVPSTAGTARSQEAYSFGVKWGTAPAAVSMQLMGRGLSFTGHDEDGDQVYSGVVDGNPAVVIAMFARGGLGKVIVAFNVPADPRAAHAAVVRRLTERYGPPASSKGDPATGGRPVITWPPRADDTGDTRVWTTITDAGDVAIHYESGGWSAETARRRQGGATGAPDEGPHGPGAGRGVE